MALNDIDEMGTELVSTKRLPRAIGRVRDLTMYHQTLLLQGGMYMGTLLHVAIAYEHDEAVRMLEARGANASLCDSDGNSCFELAADRGLEVALCGPGAVSLS